MRTKRLFDRLADATGTKPPVECVVCNATYDEEPVNCHACGNEEFRPG